MRSPTARVALVLLVCAGLARLAATPRDTTAAGAASAQNAAAQGTVAPEASDGDLERASASHTVSIKLGGATGRITSMPLEIYVARVIAGEGEPNAPAATQQALAVAIRTFAVVNAKRHAREGFSLCDTTHCQVPRLSTPASRQAALATAGRILTYGGVPAEVFYSASCGGRSERASDVWPNANFPYLQSVVDDVHEDEPEWTLALTLREIQIALAQTGASGRLTGVEIDGHTESGRVARLALPGLRPASMSGDAFRAAVGARALRSTAFTLERDGDTVRFTGRGYGHGIGMCVIGAGRRARRGETVEQILGAYYSGLALVSLDGGDERMPLSRAQAPASPAVERLEDLVPVVPAPDEPGRTPTRESTDAPAPAPPCQRQPQHRRPHRPPPHRRPRPPRARSPTPSSTAHPAGTRQSRRANTSRRPSAWPRHGVPIESQDDAGAVSSRDRAAVVGDRGATGSDDRRRALRAHRSGSAR